MGQIDDVSKSVTMDAKHAGNIVFLVGETHAELGGSHFNLVHDFNGGDVPKVDAIQAKVTFATVHDAIQKSWVRSCHDLSEGGLVASAVEMAMAGGLGMELDLSEICDQNLSPTEALFSESNTRFLIETTPENADSFAALFAAAKVKVTRLGTIQSNPNLAITVGDQSVLQSSIAEVKSAWIAPLDW